MSDTNNNDQPNHKRNLVMIFGVVAVLVVGWYGTGAAQCMARGGDTQFTIGGIVCQLQLPA